MNENDEECFKWAVTVALHHEEIGKNPNVYQTLRGTLIITAGPD